MHASIPQQNSKSSFNIATGIPFLVLQGIHPFTMANLNLTASIMTCKHSIHASFTQDTLALRATSNL